MNKNIENYKNTYSALRPSDEAIERAMNMTNEKQKISFKLTYKRLAAAALALVLFVGGGFGINHFTNKSDELTVLVAYADDNGELYFGGKSEQPLFYAIYTAPISDKKACEEVANRRQKDQTKVLNNMDEIAKKGSYAYYGAGSNGCYNKEGEETAVFYTLSGGAFELNLDDYSDVKKFEVKNESKYGMIQFEYAGQDDSELEKIAAEIDKIKDDDEREQAIEKALDEGVLKDLFSHEWTLTGDELRYSQEVGYAQGGEGRYKTNKGYLLLWEVSEALVDEISENPDFDLSQIKDSITFTVTFNDGSVKTASLNLYFDKDGYMHFE